MSTTIPYDPDEFDNNPFAEPASMPSTEVTPAVTSVEDTASPGEIDQTTENKAQPPQGNASEVSEYEERLRKLIPERFDVTSNYKILIRVHGLERSGSLNNKKENPGVIFDLQTNLPHFRKKSYKNLKKSYLEFDNFFNYLNGAHPECFVPALPLAHTNYGVTNEEDYKCVIRNFQTWFEKIVGNPILIKSEEFPYFIDSDFNTYSPINKSKVPASGLKRKTLKQLQPPYDEALELAEFRPLIKSIYQDSRAIIEKLEKLVKMKKSLGLKTNEFGQQITTLSQLEVSHAGMVNMWNKIGKTLSHIGDLESINASLDLATFADGLQAVVNDGYVIKEALTNRHLLMRELIQAQSNSRLKHEQARKLQNKRDINPIKVDEAIRAFQEATDVEESLSLKIKRITEEMLLEKAAYLKQLDLQIIELFKLYVRKNIEYERRKLNVLERVRIDVRSVDPTGGLARLGRESYPVKEHRNTSSQGPNGDSWNGDRSKSHFSTNLLKLDDPVEFDEPKEVEPDSDHEEFDAKNAASLLGESTFS